MITRKRLIRLAEAQNWRCAYCAVEMQADDKDADDAITRDRIEPGCRGGTYAVDNVVVACRACNNARGDMGALNFFKVVQNGFRPSRRRRFPATIAAQTRAKTVKRFRVTEDRSIVVTAP